MSSAETLIKKFKKIRKFPRTITRMAHLINDDCSTVQDFKELLRLDPPLVARLLDLVNCSSFGLTRKVDSISRAVALLGMKNLHNIAVTDAIQHLLLSSSSPVACTSQRLWLHSAAAGIGCKMIAERIFTLNGDDVYLCGILHDIGLIVIMAVAPDMFLQLIEQLAPGGPDIVHLERQLFLTDHCEIGYILARDWRLPNTIADAIRDHHPYSADDIAPHSVAGILQMSEYIAQQLHYPAIKDGLAMQLAPSLATHIRANVAEYKVLAEDLPEELEKTKNMYGS
jgi:Predicted signal transduction protein